MKKRILFAAAAVLMLLSGCYDDTALVNRLNEHEKQIAELKGQCETQNTNITALQSMVTALQNNDYATGCTPVKEDGKVVGFTITFSKSEPVTISLGEGKQVAAPVIGVKQDGGVYYWTVDGEFVTDASGNKIQASSKDGVTPKLKIEEGFWFVSYDNGSSWEKYSEATGEKGDKGDKGDKGENGDSIFKEVTADESYVYVTLANGQKIVLPMATGLTAGPTTVELTQVTATSATWAGKTTIASEDLPFAKVTVYYSDAASFNIHNADSYSVTDFAEDGTFTLVVEGLTDGATYNYCVVTEVKAEKYYGAIASFKVGGEEVAVSLDDKQFSFVWEAMGVDAVLDLGATEEGTLIFAIDGTVFDMEGFVPYISGNYTIEPADATSGVIKFVDPMDPSGSEVVISYSDLTETSMKITNAAPFMLDDCEATLLDEKLIIGDGSEGGDAEISVEGKQFSFVWDAMGVDAVLDLGVTEDGTLIFAIDGTVFDMEGFVPYISGNYTIEPADATSGVIKFVDPMDPSGSEVVISYSDLTETSMKITNAAPFMLDDCEATVLEEKLVIGDGSEGGDEGDDEISVEGKQFGFVWDAMGVDAVLDLGTTAEGTLIFAIDGAAFEMEGFVPYIVGNYTIEPADETSGVIKFVDPSDPSGSEVVISYSDLTETSMKITNAVPFMLENCEATVLEEKLVIQM